MRCYAGDVEAGDTLLSGQTVEVLQNGREVDTAATELRHDVKVSRVDESPFHPEHVVIRLRGSAWSVLAHRGRLVSVV